jgi:hypothetical protein
MGLAGFTPVRSWAQKPTYEAMLLSCIDPRIVDPVHNYMNARDLDGKYSQFTIAGAAIAAEAKAFQTWHQLSGTTWQPRSNFTKSSGSSPSTTATVARRGSLTVSRVLPTHLLKPIHTNEYWRLLDRMCSVGIRASGLRQASWPWMAASRCLPDKTIP